MESITVGIDLAKQVFSVCVMDDRGRVNQRLELKRETLRTWLMQLPAGTVVAMEACSGAHYWGRYCQQHGLADTGKHELILSIIRIFLRFNKQLYAQ